MLFVGTSIIHPSTEGVFLLCNILDLLIYSNKIYIKQGGWECTYYIFFFFDLGLIGAAMLVLIVLGITTIGALGEWIAENYVIVMAIILLVSVIKTLILGKEAKHGPGN